MTRFALLVLLGSLLPVEASSQTEPKPGEIAPPIVLERLLQAPAGTKTDPGSLKGNVVVLEFWATWCAPCISAMPHINDLAAKYKNKGVKFIAITNEGSDKVDPFLKKGLLKTWVGQDTDSSLLRAYAIRSIPKTFLIDKEGNIAMVTHPTELTEAVIDTLLAGKPIVSATVPIAIPVAKPLPKPLYKMELRPAVEDEEFSIMTNSNEGIVEARGVPLQALLRIALSTSDSRIIKETELPEGNFSADVVSPPGQAGTAMQSLRSILEQSLGLTFVAEKRAMPVIVLKAPNGVGAGLKPGTTSKSSTGPGVFSASGMQLQRMMPFLENKFGKPIIDETGLKDKYDWLLTYTEKDQESLKQALQTLGIHATEVTREVEVVVVRKKP